MWLRKKKNLPRSFSRFVLGRRWISSNYYINILIRNSSVMIFVNDWGGPNNVKELPFGHLLVWNGYLNIRDTFFWIWWIKIYGENWSGRTDTKKKMKVWNLDPFWGVKKATKMQNILNLTTIPLRTGNWPFFPAAPPLHKNKTTINSQTRKIEKMLQPIPSPIKSTSLRPLRTHHHQMKR